MAETTADRIRARVEARQRSQTPGDDAEQDAEILSWAADAVEALEGLRRGHTDDCFDEFHVGPCFCGAAEHNARIRKLLDALDVP